VKPSEQHHLATVIEECRQALAEVAHNGRGQAGQPLDAVAARLQEAANALFVDVRRRQRRSVGARLHHWTTPRLGLLRHHAPVPLRLPNHYFNADPPDPAPTICVVTPSYQMGELLQRTIYTVLDQRYPALEYVVQDGGSTDGTQEVLHRYADRLTSWESAPDDGQADAINRGFARTTAEIMAYLNADDLLLPGALAYVGRYFAAHPDVDVVYGHRVIVDIHDLQIGAWIMPPHDDAVLALADYVPQETLFWRRRIWDAAGGAMDTSFRFAMDWDLLLRFQAAGAKMVRLPRFLGAFRVHGGQKTLVDTVGCVTESDRLRERLHARTMSIEEVHARTAPYMRRHIVHHTAHRVAARVPLPRQLVRTRPADP
jgi:hypothetical protein